MNRRFSFEIRGLSMDTAHKASGWTKARALLAGGLVLGLGAAGTLASWTDTEWVFGGSGKGTGLEPNTPGTALVQMQQNTWTGAVGAENWVDEPNQNGGALTFTTNPGKLLPGRTVYAPLQLRATAGSEALKVSLAEGIRSTLTPDSKTNSAALYGALTYGVYRGVSKADCEAGSLAKAGAAVVVPQGSPLTATSTAATNFTLAAGTSATTAGLPENLCFALTLPHDAPASLQGLNTVPVWRFTGSVAQ